jgi:phosphoribosylanthranilate isomerase
MSAIEVSEIKVSEIEARQAGAHPKVKICGLSRDEDIEAVNSVLPDYAGFVFAPSRRQVTSKEARQLRERLDRRVIAVGVFVDESVERIATLYHQGLFEMAQLHGSYRPEQIDELKKRCDMRLGIVRAVAVDEGFAPALLRVEDGVDYVLLDYRQPGSGRRFDWRLLKGVRYPYFLAGGLSVDNLDEALALGPYGVDVSSGVETGGRKDARKIREFVEKVRHT